MQRATELDDPAVPGLMTSNGNTIGGSFDAKYVRRHHEKLEYRINYSVDFDVRYLLCHEEFFSGLLIC